MGLGHIGAEIDAVNRARALVETFGHLAPENGKVYTGSILFAHSGYGDGTVPILADFEDLPDSPWFYEGMCEFLYEHRTRKNEGRSTGGPVPMSSICIHGSGARMRKTSSKRPDTNTSSPVGSRKSQRSNYAERLFQ